jgi:hypothetical protein
MEKLPVFDLLGLQLLSLPEGLRMTTKEVFVFWDGIGLRILPANVEGERELHAWYEKFVTDPDRPRFTRPDRTD